MFYIILDLLICISENDKKTLFLGGVPRKGGGALNITDMLATYRFFYAFPKCFVNLKITITLLRICYSLSLYKNVMFVWDLPGRLGV